MLGKKKILLVENDDETRLPLAACLRLLGYEVQEATNGEEAIDSLLIALPDLIISDIHMPFKDGFELLFEAKRINPEIRVILISDVLDVQSIKEKLESADGFLAKPLHIEQIDQEVQRNLMAA